MNNKHEYIELAGVYDLFMEEVDYVSWAKKMIEISGLKATEGKILELGCGTGNLTAEFLRNGFEVVALDISSEMLTEAEIKLKNHRGRLKLLRQDMRTLDAGKGYGGIFCGCDGFNYILDEKDLLNVFKRCYQALAPGGCFVFDISSAWKLENILGNNSFREERESCEIFWTNSFDDVNRQVEMELTFFVPAEETEDGETLYRRFDEYHIQRAYNRTEVEKMLAYEGFEDIKVFGSDGVALPREKEERLFFSCKKGILV